MKLTANFIAGLSLGLGIAQSYASNEIGFFFIGIIFAIGFLITSYCTN